MKLEAFLLLVLLSVLANGQVKDENHKAKFFVKSYSTRTWTFISSFTTVVPYTCRTTIGGEDACMGRRFRRPRKLIDVAALSSDKVNLEGSQNPSEEKGKGGEDDARDNEEKLFFTIWSTLSSTVTVTTFSTNRSITVSVRALCTDSNILNFFPTC